MAVMSLAQDALLGQALLDADAMGVRLEVINGLGVWEFLPAWQHVKAEKRIAASIQRPSTAEGDCGCHWYQDLLVRFSEDSVRRPDISLSCREPDDPLVVGPGAFHPEAAVRALPQAVIEIVSKGSERKDLELSPDFYLRYGVKDVVVFDPYTGLVWHHRNDRAPVRGVSPVEIAFECGCVATV